MPAHVLANKTPLPPFTVWVLLYAFPDYRDTETVQHHSTASWINIPPYATKNNKYLVDNKCTSAPGYVPHQPIITPVYPRKSLVPRTIEIKRAGGWEKSQITWPRGCRPVTSNSTTIGSRVPPVCQHRPVLYPLGIAAKTIHHNCHADAINANSSTTAFLTQPSKFSLET